MNGNDSDHAFTRLRCMLVVFGQASVTPLPRIGPLDDPTHRQRFEARLSFRTAHDLQPVRPAGGETNYRTRVIMIPGIREDHLQPRKVAPADLSEHVLGRSGIVHVGRRHHDGEQKTQGIHKQNPVQPLNLLAAVDNPLLTAQRGPDRLAVDRRGAGVGDRPAQARASVRRTSRSFCQVPSAFQNWK